LDEGKKVGRKSLRGGRRRRFGKGKSSGRPLQLDLFLRGGEGEVLLKQKRIRKVRFRRASPAGARPIIASSNESGKGVGKVVERNPLGGRTSLVQEKEDSYLTREQTTSSLSRRPTSEMVKLSTEGKLPFRGPPPESFLHWGKSQTPRIRGGLQEGKKNTKRMTANFLKCATCGGKGILGSQKDTRGETLCCKIYPLSDRGCDKEKLQES